MTTVDKRANHDFAIGVGLGSCPRGGFIRYTDEHALCFDDHLRMHDLGGARVMGTCIAIGQAAGTAATLALREGVGPRDVDIDELRRVLRADGALV